MNTKIQDLAAMQQKMQEQMQEQMMAQMREMETKMQQQMQQQQGGAAPQAKVLDSSRPRSESMRSNASIASDTSEADLGMREEDFLVTVSRLLDSSSTLDTCLANLTQALGR